MQKQELPPAQPTGERESHRSPRRRFFETRYWLRDLILSILLAFIVIVFLYQPVQVEGTSMMPQLENHERIFITALSPSKGAISWFSGIPWIRRSLISNASSACRESG
jgi:signal peptidase I